MVDYFPKFFADRAILVYVVLLLLIPIAFGHPMAWYWWLFGLVEVCGFFYFSNALTKEWSGLRGKSLEQKLFLSSAFIRIVYVIISFFVYSVLAGDPFEFGAADSRWYDAMGRLGHDIVWGNDIKWSVFFDGVSMTDMGYPFWLMIVYSVFGKSVFIARCIKALLSSITVVLLYRIARRNFGDETARIAGVFCMLMPNLIFYCGMHLKETEMLFLTVFFIDRADLILHCSKARFGDIVLLVVVGISTYFFRGVLCALLFLSLIAAIVLGNAKIKKGGKWVLEGVLLIMFMGVLVWNRGSDVLGIGDYSNLQEQQDENLQWRANRKGGNAYAVNASSAVYAPLIFTIPFPTMVDVGFQEDQQMIHGGNYVKNITSFLTVLALLMLLFSGEWRDHVLPIAFTVGYLIILVFSSYAHSERFHIPSLPFELMFAAYGVSMFKNRHKNWFTIWLAFVFVANVGWSWFKLRGRGL